jgi:TrkA domain protein
MTEIQETQLPGVGVRHDFVTKSGDRVGVISHRTGRRDLLVYDKIDPDSCRAVVNLDEEDGHILSELLGATHVTTSLGKLQQSIEGLVIDWVPIKQSWASAGRTIEQLAIRKRTGVSIVAVIRGDDTTPSPGPEFTLESGDVAVVVGTSSGIQKLFDLLQGDHQ